MYKRQMLTFFVSTLNWVRRFGLDGMRSLSKPDAIMHPFEPHLSLQGAFHRKSALSVCSNGAMCSNLQSQFIDWWAQLVIRITDR